MKHKSIFTIFAALTMVLGFAMTGLGQASMTATAAVVSAISVSATQVLNFGTIASPSSGSPTKTIDLNNVVTGTTTNVSGVTPLHGIFTITKAASTNLSVTYTALAPVLAGPGFDMGMSAYVSNCNDDPANGLAGTSVSTNVGTWTPITAYTANTTVYVHLGATMTANTPQTAGTYTGTMTLSAVYN